jgi:hypothetical protein
VAPGSEAKVLRNALRTSQGDISTAGVAWLGFFGLFLFIGVLVAVVAGTSGT